MQELPGAQVLFQSVLPTGLGTAAKVQGLNQYLRTLAEKTGATYIDLYPAFLLVDGAVNLNLYAGDSLHLNGNGYRVWIEKIREYVE